MIAKNLRDYLIIYDFLHEEVLSWIPDFEFCVAILHLAPFNIR